MTSIQAQQVFEYVENRKMMTSFTINQAENLGFKLAGGISLQEAKRRQESGFIPESWLNKTIEDCGGNILRVRDLDRKCQLMTYINNSLFAPKDGTIYWDLVHKFKIAWPLEKGYCSVVRVINRQDEQPFTNCGPLDKYALTEFGRVASVVEEKTGNKQPRFYPDSDPEVKKMLKELLVEINQMKQASAFETRLQDINNYYNHDTTIIINNDTTITITNTIKAIPNCVGCTIAPYVQFNTLHNSSPLLNQGWSFSPEVGAFFRWCNNFYAAPRFRLSKASKWTVVEAPCANCEKLDIAPENEVTLLDDPESFSPSSGWNYDVGIRTGFEHTPWFNNHFGVYIEADAGYIHTSETDQEYFGLGGGFVYNFEQQGLLKPYARIGYGRYVPFGNRFTASAGTTLHFKNAKDKEVDDLENPINFEEDLEQKLLKELNN